MVGRKPRACRLSHAGPGLDCSLTHVLVVFWLSWWKYYLDQDLQVTIGDMVLAKRKGKEFVFLVETKKPTRTVGGSQKALINSHIARHSHQKRRAEALAAPVAGVSSGMS